MVYTKKENMRNAVPKMALWHELDILRNNDTEKIIIIHSIEITITIFQTTRPFGSNKQIGKQTNRIPKKRGAKKCWRCGGGGGGMVDKVFIDLIYRFTTQYCHFFILIFKHLVKIPSIFIDIVVVRIVLNPMA